MSESSDTAESQEQDSGCPVGAFRPRSNRQGIANLKAVWWSMFIGVMAYIERRLSKDVYNRNSWDKWPVPLGLVFLISKIRDLRTGSLTDPYDYKTTDNKELGSIPKEAEIGNLADGMWASDDENPQMGATCTRFSSNTEPQRVSTDHDHLLSLSRKLARVRWRKLDADGNEIMVPALILNDKAGAWIQFQFHGFGGNTKRDSINQNPHVVCMRHDADWGHDDMVVNRTSEDHTRVDYDGRPTPLNERPHAWIQAQIYGGTEAELAALRSFENGKMRLVDGRLPEDPVVEGIDQTGFNQNFNPQLSYLHWLFVNEHNAIAEHLSNFYPTWDDEKLFRMAAKINQANMARIHTDEWTRDLLQHPTLHAGMHADWYGIFGKRIKLYLMRLFHRRPWLGRVAKRFTDNDVLWGMPGSKWDHYDGPFQVPKQFRMVYRLHELIRGTHRMLEPGTDRELGRHDLLNIVHENTREIVDKYGYDVLGYSISRASCGALTLHNFPRALTNFENQQDGKPTDLAALDLFREMTDGTGTYNEFRMSVGLEQVTSFMELTGGHADLAHELEVLYEYDIESVHPGIGILAEPKPPGFALSYSQFYQFVLNAPRRVKSNRHFTEGFTIDQYTPEGMAWVEHSGSMLDVERRHLGGLNYGAEVCDAMEGVIRPFAPWPSAEKFPRRMLRQIELDSDKVIRTNIAAFGIAVAASIAAISAGLMTTWFAIILGFVLILPGIVLWMKRLLARWFMQSVVERAYTQRAPEMFPQLRRAEHWGNRASTLGRIASLVATGLLAYMSWELLKVSPWPTLLALAATAVALTGLLWSRTTWIRYVCGIGMLAGLVVWPQSFGAAFFLLSAITAFWTFHATKVYQRDMEVLKVALLKRLRRSQESCPADNASNCSVSETENHELNDEQFVRMLRQFAPGREYITAYDLARKREADHLRNKEEGVGNWFSRTRQRLIAPRRDRQLMKQHADHVVTENYRLVPAISRDVLRKIF